MTSKMFFDLSMSRHWLASASSRIHIPVMAAAVANENTSASFDLPDQIDALHAI
jgi:hypothetical protein